MDQNSDIERTSEGKQPDASVTFNAVPPEQKRTLKQKIAGVVWDSLDKTPEERRFVAKIDWWILSYCCISYFCKYLDQTNVSLTYSLTRKSLLPRLTWDYSRLRSAMPTLVE